MRRTSGPIKPRAVTNLTVSERADVDYLTNRAKIRVNLDGDYILLDIDPDPEESKILLKKLLPEYADAAKYFGLLSPTIIIVENYVEFFLTRYEQVLPTLRIQGSPQRESKLQELRDGLLAEKAFDLLLQNLALSVHYPEPIRDWRAIYSADFKIPLLGTIEVKSVTDYKGGRVNVNLMQFNRDNPDFIVAMRYLSGRWVMLVGAMTREQIHSYVDTPFHVQTDQPFLSIPWTDFSTAIPPRKLYDALEEIALRINTLEKVNLA